MEPIKLCISLGTCDQAAQTKSVKILKDIKKRNITESERERGRQGRDRPERQGQRVMWWREPRMKRGTTAPTRLGLFYSNHFGLAHCSQPQAASRLEDHKCRRCFFIGQIGSLIPFLPTMAWPVLHFSSDWLVQGSRFSGEWHWE